MSSNCEFQVHEAVRAKPAGEISLADFVPWSSWWNGQLKSSNEKLFVEPSSCRKHNRWKDGLCQADSPWFFAQLFSKPESSKPRASVVFIKGLPRAPGSMSSELRQKSVCDLPAIFLSSIMMSSSDSWSWVACLKKCLSTGLLSREV